MIRLILLHLFLVGLLFAFSGKQTPTRIFSASTIPEDKTIFNANKWVYWQTLLGKSGNNPYTGDAGGFYPALTRVIFADGLVVGVRSSTASQEFRLGGTTYRSSLFAGNWQQYIQSKRMYRIRPDWQSLTDEQVRLEASVIFNMDPLSVTEDMIQQIRDAYAYDWQNWPVTLGAPYVDVDNNGIYNPVLDGNGYPDPTKGDYPGIKDATQTIWYVMSDGDSQLSHNFYGSDSIGFELQVTVWGYDFIPYQDVIFKKYKFIYHGETPAEEVRFGYWMDPDIGHYADDLVGCMPQYNLGYAYNSGQFDREFDAYSLVPPAMGVMFLPWANPDSDFTQLHSFGYFASGGTWADPFLGSYDGTLQWFNLLRGYLPSTDIQNPPPFTHQTGPQKGQQTFFPLDGDPGAGSSNGDVDGVNQPPGDRRIVITLPPIAMNPGDVKEFTFAIVAKMGMDHIYSVNQLRKLAKVIQSEQLKPLKIEVVKQDIQFSETTENPEINFQFKITDKTRTISAARLLFSSKELSTYMESLHDDGQNGDVSAGDSIWTVNSVVKMSLAPVFVDLELTFSDGSTLMVPGVFEYLTMRKPPVLEDYRLVWENGKQDGKLNHGETAKFQLKLKNASNYDNQFSISQINLHIEGFQKKFDVNIQPGGVDSTTVYFLLTAPDSGSVYKTNLYLSFNGNPVVYPLTFNLTSWTPTKFWGDTLEVKNISGTAMSLYPIVADASLLNGHKYNVTFHKKYDAASGDTILVWNLKDLTTGEIKLYDLPVPEQELMVNPVVDGIQWILYSPPPAIDAIVQVADADGPLTEDEYDQIGAPYGGNNVWHSLSSPNDANRFYISAGGGSGNIERIARSIFNANNHDFEIRFTDQDTSILCWWYDGNYYQRVGFEAWDVGPGTYDDPSDDVRLLTGAYSGGNTPGVLDFAYIDPTYGFPATDWIYLRRPVDAEGSYAAFANDVSSEQFTYTWYDHSIEVLARIIFCDFGGAGTLPPPGTVIRFITAKVFSPQDTLVVEATVTGVKETAIPPLTYELKQNYPNPFNPTTTIAFALPRNEQVRLEIFNILGQKVRTLINTQMAAGKHQIVWDGKNEQGITVPSGIYIYRLKTDHFSATKRMVLLK